MGTFARQIKPRLHLFCDAVSAKGSNLQPDATTGRVSSRRERPQEWRTLHQPRIMVHTTGAPLGVTDDV